MKAMISSTALDLPEHRACAFAACLAQQFQPVGMEHLPAWDESAVRASMALVDQADVYVGIYAWRYGWVPPGSEISITEMEFNRALERKARGELREIFVFVADKDHTFRITDIETDNTAQARLKAFKERAMTDRISRTFRSAGELQRLVSEALGHFRLRTAGRTSSSDPVQSHAGFKPSAELASRVEDLADELAAKALAGRSDRIAELNRFLDRPGGFLLVTGDAGYGKSAMLAHWVKQRAASPRIVQHLFSCRSDLTRSVLEFYRALLATLVSHWHLPPLPLPSAENEAREALFALLEEARASGRAKSAPVLLVVDALDEAAPAGRWDSPFFPKRLPDGLYVVASVRLADDEEVPPHLIEWVAQADGRLTVPRLDHEGVRDWLRQLGGNVGLLAEDETAIGALLQKTQGLPLHLAYLLEDLAAQPAPREDLLRAIEQMPAGFLAYVNLQFRRLVESPVGKDHRWQELFGLLVAAKAELQRDDLSALLGLTPWELHAMPPELRRWISQRDDGYAFRSEALRTAFGRLDPWPPARERLLAYAEKWSEHHRPYALRALVPHLREQADRSRWFAVAGNRAFLAQQGKAFPNEPLLPLQTVEDAMAETIAIGDLVSLCRLALVHARWMTDLRETNPMDVVLSNGGLAREQIRLAKATDPTTEVMWQILAAWRLSVEGRTDEARRFLREIPAEPRRPLHTGYCAHIAGRLLPLLVDIDAELSQKIARTLLDTPELPRFLAATLPPEIAIAQTRECYERKRELGRSGRFALYLRLAEKGATAAVLENAKDLSMFERSLMLTRLALTLGRLGQLESLRQCLAEVENSEPVPASAVDYMLKPRVVLLAEIGTLQLRAGEPGGRDLLEQAKSLAATMPFALPHKSEALAALGAAWARGGAAPEAIQTFDEAMKLTDRADVSTGLAAGTLVDVAQLLFSAYEACPQLRERAIELLRRLEALAQRPGSHEMENNIRRAIAEGWDVLGQSDQAWEWVRRIPNPQQRGKTVAHLVSQRLRDGRVAEAEELLRQKGGTYPGWGFYQLGAYHLDRQNWDAAGQAFAKAVQSSATRVGTLKSPNITLLLAELARIHDANGEPALAVKYLTAALRRANQIQGPIRLWYLLNIAERTLGLHSTNLGDQALEEATERAFEEMTDPERIPLLCLVARVHHLVAGQPQRAREALKRANTIVRKCIPDPVKGTIARCEIAETLHACGLDPQRELKTIYEYAEQRRAIPSDRADEVIAEAALGHARVGRLDSAERLLALLGKRHFDSAARARATVCVHRGQDADAERALARIRNDNYRTKVRRDLACIFISLGRPEQALGIARRIQVDRDNAFPRIAEHLVARGFRDAFFEIVIPATRFPNATPVILACLLRLDPKLASQVDLLLEEFTPGLLSSARPTDRALPA